MGLFKKIGKALGGAAKAVGNVATKAVGVVAKVASNPLVSGALGLAAGIALPGIGGKLMQGVTTTISKVGNKIKGLKMGSAIDGVLDNVSDQANEAAKGFLGIGDGKPGIFGIGTGKNKKRAGSQLEDDDLNQDDGGSSSGSGSGSDSDSDSDSDIPSGGGGTILVGAGDKPKPKPASSGGVGLGGLLLGGFGLWALFKKGS